MCKEPGRGFEFNSSKETELQYFDRESMDSADLDLSEFQYSFQSTQTHTVS